MVSPRGTSIRKNNFASYFKGVVVLLVGVVIEEQFSSVWNSERSLTLSPLMVAFLTTYSVETDNNL